jgi:hypothetical protein
MCPCTSRTCSSARHCLFYGCAERQIRRLFASSKLMPLIDCAALTARNRCDHQQRLHSQGDRLGQRSIKRRESKVLFAGVVPQERSPLMRDVVANRAAEHWVAGLQRVEHRADCDRRLNVELHPGRDVGEHSQVVGDFDSDHGPDSHDAGFPADE